MVGNVVFRMSIDMKGSNAILQPIADGTPVLLPRRSSDTDVRTHYRGRLMKAAASHCAHLSDAALLQKLIGIRESRRLYKGSLQSVFSSQSEELPNEKCAVARELVKRWLGEELQQRCVLSQPSAVRDYLRIHFSGQEYESFVTLFLDAQNRLVACEDLFRGTLTQTSVYPREVVKGALRHNAAGVIFSHNHPSGVAEPSRADESLTQALKQALALVDVRVLDHFVVAGNHTLSFAERGLL